MTIEKQPNASPWIEVWFRALTQPSVNTFEQISNAPGASRFRALIWIGVSAFIVSLGITFLLLSGMLFNIRTTGFPLWTLSIPPLVAILSIFWLSLGADISQFIATRLGGSGSSDKLTYSLAASLAPLILAAGIVCIVPFGVCLVAPLGIYGIFLNLLSIKAINRFDWGKAVLTSLPFLIINIGGLILILALLGPTVEAWFTPLFTD